MAKKYKIISPFTYKGKDGREKQENHIRFGPGEDMPELESEELNRLIIQEKIAEISKETGEIIISKKITNLNATEVDRIMGKSVASILSIVNSGELSIETLGKMLVVAEREKMDSRIKNTIEEQINQKAST